MIFLTAIRYVSLPDPKPKVSLKACLESFNGYPAQKSDARPTPTLSCGPASSSGNERRDPEAPKPLNQLTLFMTPFFFLPFPPKKRMSSPKTT
jgi:hypothetical protein